MGRRQMACFAISRKHGGNCIAGKRTKSNIGTWMRPVSSTSSGQLDYNDIQFQDGSIPKLLDVITVDIQKSCPTNYQTENQLIDSSTYWVLDHQMDYATALSFADAPVTLWYNNSQSKSGKNDRIEQHEITHCNNSLYLINVTDLVIHVLSGFNGNDPKKIRASFHYNQIKYDLKITDNEIESKYGKMQNDSYSIGESLLTISLGTSSPHDNCFYKLVAGVIIPP